MNPMTRPRLPIVTLIVLLGVLVTPIYANGGPKPSAIEARGIAAMQAGDYQEAETVFRQLIKLRSDSFVGYYNLGAALSMQGDVGGAVDAISQAITIGFSDLNQIKRDPDLESFRSSGFFGDLVENWQALIEARRQNDLENMKLLITRRPESRTDEAHKIELLSAHDAIATDEAIEELAMIATWAQGNIFPESASPEVLEDLPWIMVVLPDRAGFAKWAIKVFGPSVRNSMSSVGGAYEHQNRRLVAQDLGATIRHEFIHVLHWRDMNRLGQVHAPWIQEGLASLVEDYDMVGGKPVPVASWRTNIVKRMSERHRMPSIEKLASTEMNAFTAKRPLAKYAQARAVMLYLYDQGLLGKFYATYTEQYHEDPTGISALETVLAQDLNAIEKDYRNWIERLEAVPETGKDLSATMGIGIENGTGDGVVVKELPGNARSRTGLHVGSVITAINGHPTRDLFELIRIIGKYEPGQTITLSVRRGKLHSTTEVELLAR